MSRLTLLLAAAAVALAASAAQAQQKYYPGVQQPPAGGSHYTYGPALVYDGVQPDAHATPDQFNGWNADAKPPMVLGAPPQSKPRVTGFRAWFPDFSSPVPRGQYKQPGGRATWNSYRYGY